MMVALGAVFAGGLLSSCTNEYEPSNLKNGMLAKAPNMVAYSGNHYWGTTNGTRSSNMNANMWGETFDCPVRDAEDLTETELAELKELLSPGHQVENEVVINFEEYWVQQIFKGDATYTPDDVFGDPCNGQSILGSNQMDHFEVMGKYGYERVENFDHGDNKNRPGNCSVCGESHFGTTLKVDMPVSNTDPTNQFRYWESYGSDNYFNYIIVEYKGYYYLGFDYQMEKEAYNPNEADHVDRDWNFTDWIVRIVPAYHKGNTPSENPGGVTTPSEPNPGPGTCEKCDHPAHQPGECPEEDCTTEECHPSSPCPKVDCEHKKHPEYGCQTCYEEGRINDCSILYFEWLLDQGLATEDDDPRNQGSEQPNPGYEKGKDEVEVNLALDKKNHDLLESHLSIHVRKATNVEVFIPVPAQYYCAADDMDIVLNHGNLVHGGPIKTEYEIGDKKVTLNVSFEEDGIRIRTEGIDQDVIDYCWENYQDGITFEIWNYFNNPETGLPYIGMEELKGYLDQATVKFLDKEPGRYINAFGRLNGKYSEENPDGKDFHVTPDEQHQGSFDDPYEGPHLNGSDNNDIYNKKNAQSQDPDQNQE